MAGKPNRDLYQARPDLYDLMHEDQVEDVRFVRDYAATLISGARVLELGCGTGRLLLPLLDAGAAVTVVVVVAPITVWIRGSLTLAPYVLSAPAVMTCVPPESDTVMVAELWSVGTTCAPRNVSKSGVMIWTFPRVEPPSKN